MKSKYETHVKSRFKEIKQWCQNGSTDKEIYTALGISKDTFYSYLKKHSDFSDLIKNNRINAIKEIKNALYKRATGFQYIETKKTITENDDGDRTIKTEKTTKMVLPDPASCMILLKHWDKETEWTNDPATLKLKKKELELKKKIAEQNNW